MKFHSKNRWIVMSLLAAFFLAACGGGGGDSSAPPTPVVTTGNATGISNIGATLNGTVNPNGLATEAWFEWGTSSTLATSDNTAKQSLAAGTTVNNVSASISGLSFGTTYYFRMVASNSSGVSKGTIGNFSTSSQRPTVTTLAADNLTPASATLHGEVNPNSLDTQAWFEHSTDNVTFTPTTAVPVGSGSGVVPTSANISGLTPGGTVYFRAAASNAAGEQKGAILTLSTANIPPVANAGTDNTVEMGQTVTLNGSGTATDPKTITSFLWTQVAGTTVTLDNDALASPTFTAPDNVARTGEVLRFQLTVTDSGSLSASDNVDITVKWVGFADDFSTDTITGGTYNPTQTQVNPTGTLTYDAAGKRALVVTGDDVGLKFSNPFPASTSGVFSLDFSPTAAHPSHGGIWVRLFQGNPLDNNCYEITNFDWGAGTPVLPDIAAVKKIVGGVVVDTVAVPTAYTQGSTYNIKITFSSTQVVLEGFGAPVTLNTADTTAISVTSFEIETGQQDAYYDNIKLLAHP